MRKKALISCVVVTRNRKEELTKCVSTLYSSSYKPIEVLVVDNNSDIEVSRYLKRKFPKVKIVRTKRNVGAAEGRNIGIKRTSGSYIFFTDDDAFIDKYTLQYLYNDLVRKKSYGIVQPKVYDREKPNYYQGIGHTINLLTGRPKAWGVMEKDLGQYESLREIPMTGGICLVKREVIDDIGMFDEEYFIPYEDSDLSIRATKAGYKVLSSGKAKAWHRGKKKTAVHPWLEWLGVTTPERVYRVSRNKIIFMKKHAPLFNLIVFMFFFLPIYALIHSAIIIVTTRYDILANYWKGLISGIFYIFGCREQT